MQRESREFRLYAALNDELAGASVLRGVLERESDVLASLRGDELGEVVEAKHKAIGVLQLAARERDAAITELGFSADAEGVVAYMKTSSPSTQLVELWHRLEHEISVCADLNRSNELLNQAGQRRTQQLLRLLRGQSADPLTYEQLVRG